LDDTERGWLIAEAEATPLNESDVNNSLMRFRKTILGLEKYRINDPVAIAQKYCGSEEPKTS
jgi:hypothetical protein